MVSKNHRKVEKHDHGLAPGVLPKTPLARQQSADNQTYSHREFKQQR
jgi:hypothetical protein